MSDFIIINPGDEQSSLTIFPGLSSGPPGPQGPTPDVSNYLANTTTTTVGGVLTIDARLASTFFIHLTENITSIVIGHWPSVGRSQRIALYFQQDGTGSRTITGWPSGTKWSYGVPMTLTTAPNAIDCVMLDSFDAGATIFAGVVGQFFS